MSYTLRNSKIKYDYPTPTVSGKESDGYYQNLEFDTNALPEISSWQVGEEYFLIVKVREKNHELLKSENKGVKEKACFEVLEVGAFIDGMDIFREKVKKQLK